MTPSPRKAAAYPAAGIQTAAACTTAPTGMPCAAPAGPSSPTPAAARRAPQSPRRPPPNAPIGPGQGCTGTRADFDEPIFETFTPGSPAYLHTIPRLSSGRRSRDRSARMNLSIQKGIASRGATLEALGRAELWPGTARETNNSRCHTTNFSRKIDDFRSEYRCAFGGVYSYQRSKPGPPTTAGFARRFSEVVVRPGVSRGRSSGQYIYPGIFLWYQYF
mmetsp:Transcript_58845/g.133208  ORF Transcript_58845/g.133208 Transcript_58845/m.133208 type:complete len:219 (+) Transcript_58845:2093-2749(+)